MKKGFTLIELMIVISIITILAVLVIPNVIAYRERATSSPDMVIIEKKTVEHSTENPTVEKAKESYDKWGNSESRY